MDLNLIQIGFGGSCHWCTEGIFRSINGVVQVEQGWIASSPPHETWSEAIWLSFDPAIIDLATLVAIHLHSHSCTSNHGMRNKYRSAVYFFDSIQKPEALQAITMAEPDFDQPILTHVLPFSDFKLNQETFLDYYYKNPEKPFCTTYIAPKLRSLMQKFGKHINQEKTAHLK